MGQSCTCQGANENCARCYGTGVVERQSEGYQGPAAGLRQNTIGWIPSKTSAPVCPPGRPLKLVPRRKRASRPRRPRAVSLRVQADGVGLSSCPECGVAVRADRLERHRRTIHRTVSTFRLNEVATWI